jgi:hypothetical protein
MLKASEQGIIPTEVLCGACRWEEIERAVQRGEEPPLPNNADMLGERWATQHGLPVAYHFANWTRGRGAGPERNARMAEEGEALVLVWDGESRGSASMRRLARARRLPVVEQMIKGGAR